MAATYTARNDGMRGGTVEREKALEVALLQIEKQFGKGSVMRMGVDGPADPVQAISTGSLALDLALGIGGVPRGRVVEIYGPEASGKTTLALHIIAEAQKTGGIAAFIDSEHALDVTYARNLGVNTDELLISQPDTGEQALEIADMLIRSGAIDVIVVDSVAALVPRAEIEGEMGDSHVGLQARLMSQALRKLSGTISKSKTTAIFINQLREKIGVLFGSPETTSGGRALKFYASVRLDVRRIESLKDGPEVVGNRTRAKVVKNKLAPPFRSAEFDVIYGQGISKEGSLLDVGVDVGLIKKSGAWFTYDGDQLGQGRENSRNFLRDNPELAREIEEKIKAQLGIGLPPAPAPTLDADDPKPKDEEAEPGQSSEPGPEYRRARAGPRSRRAPPWAPPFMGTGLMVVGRRGRVGARRVQPGGGAPLDGERAGSVDAAHAAALRLLTTRARTRAELRQRLEDRGFEAAVVAETLDRLERVGLVDDAALAETVAAGRAERGLDAPAIAAELRDRGVDPTVAERAADMAVPAEDRADRCRQVAEARLAQLADLPAPTQLRRLAAYLARRGYPPELAESVAREVVGFD